MQQTPDEPNQDTTLLAPVLKRVRPGQALAFMVFREGCSTVRSIVKSLALPVTLVFLAVYGGPPVANAILRNWSQIVTNAAPASTTTATGSVSTASSSGTNAAVVSRADSTP